MKRVLELSGQQTLSRVWPQFECFFHGGVNIASYQSSFAKLFHHPVRLRETYTASEGFFAFQPDAEKGMWLMTDHGIFYEFIPFKDFQLGEKNALPLEAVSADTPYVQVVTTNNGLWRYITGDVVTFTSTHPHYRVVVSGRTASFINLFGEELMVQNTDLALQRVCQRMHCTIREYSVAPYFSADTGSGHHDWLIEFETSPSSLADFEKELDNNLREINSDYDTKRSSGNLLLPLKIRPATAGTFARWLSARNKTQAQSKVPRLLPQREVLDEMLRCA